MSLSLRLGLGAAKAMSADDVDTTSGGGMGSCLTHPLQHRQRVRHPEILTLGANELGVCNCIFFLSLEKEQLDFKECATRLQPTIVSV
jgi:hypothetical protein